MAAYVPTALRQLVIQRADEKCEYCLMHQTFSIYSHEIDHVVALKHGGQTDEENLVLACLPCNRHKGSDLTSIDPLTGNIAPLLNPRLQVWSDHLKLQGGHILGLTPTGRTTVFLLKLNEPVRLRLRQSLLTNGLYPSFG